MDPVRVRIPAPRRGRLGARRARDAPHRAVPPRGLARAAGGRRLPRGGDHRADRRGPGAAPIVHRPPAGRADPAVLITAPVMTVLALRAAVIGPVDRTAG